jgi:ZIP family zinc transporter
MVLESTLQQAFFNTASIINNLNLTLAFLYTFLAGLSTVIGGALIFFTRQQNKTMLATGLGIAAGMMIYISLGDLLTHESIEFFKEAGVENTSIYMIGFFLVGLVISYLIDLIIPHIFHLHSKEDEKALKEENKKLFHSGVFTALGIGLHNLPEGLLTFIATLADPTLGLATGIAVTLHNIPEGLSIAMPIYHATGSKPKAIWYSFLAGMAEMVGAVVAFIFLLRVVDQLDFVFGAAFAIVSGIMIYISFDEILPTAYRHGKSHTVLYGVLTGMLIMGFSLILLH